MSLNNRAHLVAFAVALGTVAYLSSALWSAIFIVSLPMDEDAVTDAIEIETGEDRFGNVETEWRPIEFKNSLEELKYHHNVRMRNRNRYWVYAQLICGGLIGIVCFYTVPKWRGTLEDYDGAGISGAILGVLVVLIVPFVISWVLPAPYKWFPKEICDIAEVREKEALSRLVPLARQMDRDRFFEEEY